MKKFGKLIFLFAVSYLLLTNCAFAQQGIYPQLDISGFKKWEFKKAEVNPSTNYFSGLTHLGGFYPTFTGGPWQERLQLRILGQLSEQLSVTYDLEQQPETPDRYDVKVKYENIGKAAPEQALQTLPATPIPALPQNTELTFGDFSANFTGNEFASASKYLNGVMFTAKDSWADVTVVPSAKLKSQTQKLTTQKGNNTKGPYSLGHGTIVEGSEKIELNGVSLKRNVDYTLDYFEGKITFNRILTQADEFKYSYEYTNILDLFFPALSKRDFFGFQSRLTLDPEKIGKPTPKLEAVINSAREAFPSMSTLESESERIEEEASGHYRLQNIPVVRFSEHLTFMGTELKKNEDYIMRYTQGEIKLLTRFLPSPDEPLTVEYKFYQTSAESESVAGIDSRGPYDLAQDHLVPESERIEVDGKLFVRDLDYSIDYDAGEITFGILIGSTSQIKASYRYNVLAIPTAAASEHPRELKIGTTYLRETAKAGAVANTATAIESISGQTIINNNYHLYLQNLPVVSTGESFYLTVKIGATTLTRESSYAVPSTLLDSSTGYYTATPEATLAYINDHTDPSDGYKTGTIKILDQSLISSTNEVTVTYAYYKSVVGRYSGVGDGTRGPYYLRNIRNVVPGTESIQVWDQGSSVITTYTRNSSFEANAGNTGYTVNYHDDNPYVLFNAELGTTKNFQIIYQYVPPSGFSSDQDLTQSVFGLDSSFKIGELFKIETAYAKSEIDRYIAREPTTESFAGNGSKSYALHSSQDIIESSELIYVNDQLLNKDIDYYFSYTKPGQVSFYYITPTTLDAIRVDYDFQSLGAAVGQITTKTGNAYRLGAETKLFGKALTLSGNSKKIDYFFTPMGGTSIGLGSQYNDYNVKLNPGFHSSFINYSYKENLNPIGSYQDRFLRGHDNSISAGISPGGVAKVDLAYRNYKTLDDFLPTTTTHSSDNLQESYSLSLTPGQWSRGVVSLSQKYDLRRTFSQADVLRDSNRFSESTTDYWHANGTLKLTERLSAGYDYQQSEPTTISLLTSTVEATSEAVSSHTRTTDTSYNFTVDLTPGFLQKWTARFSLLNHTGYTLVKNFVSTQEALVTRNETYHTDFVPFSILTSSLDHNRQERTTRVVGGTNPKTERTSAAARLSPLSWLGVSWNGSQSEAIPETGITNRTSGRANSYSADYTPLSFSRFKLGSRFTLSDNLQSAPSGATQEVTTNTNSFAQNYTINLTLHSAAPLTVGLTIEDYKNRNDHPTSTSRIDTQTQNQTYTGGLTFNFIPKLTLISNYNLKITKVLQDLSLSAQERRKTVFDNKATYQISSWGTLVYNRQDEKNGGEIQAGSIADLNIEKITQTYSLNINFPVENPVLSSFVFLASIKSVDYKNLNSSSDDFVAALTTFEGSLNF